MPLKPTAPDSPLLPRRLDEERSDQRSTHRDHGALRACRSCGALFRSKEDRCVDCQRCAPPLVERIVSRRRVRTRPPVNSPYVPERFRGYALRPMTTSECIAVLGDICASLAGREISGHQARVMILAVRVQARLLEEQERRLFWERSEKRRREQKAVMLVRQAAAKRRKQLDRNNAKNRAKSLERKRAGASRATGVQPIEITDVERRLAEG